MNLKVENISAGYGRVPIISRISLKISPGRICALMGRNGSGKTTLLRCITGVLPAWEGRIEVLGQDIRKLGRSRIARMISTVPQVSFSPFSFSCLDMVLMAGVSRIRPWSAPGAKEKQKALNMMAETGIERMSARPFNTLSGGERQLVMLARGLFQDTPVMLLDEPNSHLDFANQHKIMSLIRHLTQKRRMTVLITLHDPNLAYHYCDDVMLIHKGSVRAWGEIQTTLNTEVLSSVLGGNIECDITKKGVFVVIPKQLQANMN